MFETVLDGTAIGTTSRVPVGGASTGAGTFILSIAAGAHTVDLWDYILSYIGGESPYGGAVDDTFSPADVSLKVAFVPEPASALLFGAGCWASGFSGRAPESGRGKPFTRAPRHEGASRRNTRPKSAVTRSRMNRSKRLSHEPQHSAGHGQSQPNHRGRATAAAMALAIALNWLTALLVLAQFGLAELRIYFPRPRGI